MESFYPTNYEVPQSGGNYMKFIKGENRFRIMSLPTLGYEYFAKELNEDKYVPVRVRMTETIPWEDVIARTKRHTQSELKHFHAFVVWNVREKKVQVLEITQKKIQQSIMSFSKLADWGDPRTYDIIVTRDGDGLDTNYQTMPAPKTKWTEEMKQAYKDANVDLEALFDNEDPFAKAKTTPKLEDQVPETPTAKLKTKAHKLAEESKDQDVDPDDISF